MRPRHTDPWFYLFILSAGLTTWIAPVLFLSTLSVGLAGALLWELLAAVESLFWRWRNGPAK